MQQFKSVTKYKKGVTNQIADMLSRPPKAIVSVLTTAM